MPLLELGFLRLCAPATEVSFQGWRTGKARSHFAFFEASEPQLCISCICTCEACAVGKLRLSCPCSCYPKQSKGFITSPTMLYRAQEQDCVATIA